MMNKKGTLIFFCGKMGAGKSTLAKQLTRESHAILLSEDEWLKVLFPEEINNFEDYLKYSSRLKPLMKRHVRDILNAGKSVIMDFPGNTVNQRKWFKDICVENNLPHKLIYLDMSDAQCLKQLKKRNISNPERAHFDTEAVFNQITHYFQPPMEDENLNIEVVKKQ